MQPDSLLRQPLLFCDRAWPWVKKRARQQAKPTQRFRQVMLSFELFCACDVLPVLLRATRPGWATELAEHKRWQNRLQKRE